ncbi:MAG: twin-arginine translocase TatA/TatE family subunit [Phycisphaerales bacterium]|nr:MAG: twin-arginine translocase TatA/TatE family subunit [Phycisphaerales bacterium]
MQTLGQTLAFIQNIGTTELIIILVIGLLIFGRRLPEVGRGVGKAIVEFKRGLRGIDDEIEAGVNADKGDKKDQPQLDQQRPGGTLPHTTADSAAPVAPSKLETSDQKNV